MIYVEHYLKVLEKYYLHNKLQISSSKTKIMMTKNPKNHQQGNNLRFTTSKGETITACNSMKILGFVKNNRDFMDSHLCMVGGRVTAILEELSPLLKHMSLKICKEVIYAKAASVLLYGAELYTGLTQWTTNKLTAILMRCNRAIFRKEWFKVSNRRICREINVDLPDQMCKKLTLKIFHKLIWSKSPPQLFNQLKFSNKHRDCSMIGLNCTPGKQSCKKTTMQTGIQLFNNLPLGLKIMLPKVFEKELTKMKI